MSRKYDVDGPICAPAMQRVVIEDFEDSFNNIGATTEHAERLFSASAEYSLCSGYTHSIHNIRSESEWDKFWDEKEPPLIRKLVSVTHTLYIRKLALSKAIPRSMCTNSPVLQSRRRLEI